MRRIVSIVAFLMMLGWMLGVPPLAVTDSCGERCPDSSDGDDGGCPPACHCCAHASRLATLAPAAAAAPPTAGSSTGLAIAYRAPATPEPDDIFHVPKRALA